ncbi:helix-turn-helix domain-containing protein [Luteimonas terrae]|uniref:XRE family transcriptional regulator n=1 Tax=Luteimonas terrae TaxID=1530191 RepID=A0A4R5U9B7_9GAMM|nr:XRE family transcriptional regulator [Luteimonas terrae]
MNSDNAPNRPQQAITWLEIVGTILRLHRQAANVTQGDVATAIGAAGHGSVARFERGIASPSVEQLAQIAQCCRTSPSAFMRDADGARLLLERLGVRITDTRREMDALIEAGGYSRDRSVLDHVNRYIDGYHGRADERATAIQLIREASRGFHLEDYRGDVPW